MSEKRGLIKRRTNKTFQTCLIEMKATKGLKNKMHGAANQQLDLMSKQIAKWTMT